MGEPVKREYVIPDGLTKDMELMNIWRQALDDYEDDLNTEQVTMAIRWLETYFHMRATEIYGSGQVFETGSRRS